MDITAITDYEEMTKQPQKDLYKVQQKFSGVQQEIAEIKNRLIDTEDDCPEFIEIGQQLSILKAKEEKYQTAVMKAEKRAAQVESDPDVRASKTAAIHAIDHQLQTLEVQKEAKEQACNELLEQAYDLAAEYWRLQIEQDRVKETAIQKLGYKSRVMTDGRPAVRLVERVQKEAILRSKLKAML